LFPNPAGSQTSIVFSLPAREDITIRILDAAGKLVSIPYQHYRVDTGVRVVPLYTGGMAAGVYFINTSFGGKPRTLRLVVGH